MNIKKYLISSILVSSILVSISIPISSLAAVSYSRTPSGTSVSNPVSFDVSFNNFLADTGAAAGCWTPALGEVDCRFWGAAVNNRSGESFGTGESFDSNTTSGHFSINLPTPFEATLVQISVCYAQSDCNAEKPFESVTTTANGIVDLEGDGQSVIFTVPAPPGPPSGGTASPVQYPPEVNILSPKAADVFGGKVEIKYQAKDQNDAAGGTGAERFGLTQNPVSIYFVDNIDIIPGKRVADEDKKLIAKDLPAGQAGLPGTFLWDTKDIPEGFFYRVVIDAVDKYGDQGESVSPVFSIDHTAPVFTVKADPVVSRGENIKITVTSSKDLVRPPKVVVTQRDFRPVEIGVETNNLSRLNLNRLFEGTYYVSTGYDGPAAISVSGEDLIGNIGDVIASGGSFSVGVEPPPKPLIRTPIDKDITTSQVVSVKGRAREDTEVVVTVNGKDEYKTKPDKDGNFILDNVRLYPDFNKGVNFISVVAKDAAGNTSEAASLSIKFNLTPELAILSPPPAATAPLLGKEGKGEVTGTTTIRISASDKNNDPLTFSYEISKDDPSITLGASWILLTENTTRKQIVWRTADFADGEYRIRVTASDGTTKTEVVSETFFVKNNLPVISFDGGEKTISNKKDAALAGGILSLENTILGLEYSLDGGKSWLTATARDGAFNSASENFAVSLTDLKEGLYAILFRARDARGLYGRATKTLIIDFGPPLPPEVQPPMEVEPPYIISGADDTDPSAAGAQFTLSGTSEPQSRVSALIDGKTFSAKASEKGEFKIPGVTLKAHGRNEIILFATDLAENKSPEAKISLTYNNPPALKFLSPRDGRGLNHKAVVRWEVADPDGDEIKEPKLSWRRGNNPFQLLTSNPKLRKFDWDVSRLADARDYEFKLEATDGVSSSEKIVSFIVDNTPPEIFLEPLAKTAFNKSFTLAMRGSARDNFSGVEFVEYGIDNEHWFKALISEGFLQKSASWTVRHPFILDDGVYILRVRAVDAAGNMSQADTQTILVDTTPPRIGSFTISKGPMMLLPESGIFKILVDTKILMDISMERDTGKAEILLKSDFDRNLPPSPLPRGGGEGGGFTSLLKNKSTGLWETELNFPETGKFDLLISAEDALGNKTLNKKIGEVEVVRRGKTESQVKITAFVKQPDAGFVRWQGEAYGAENPVLSDNNGEYDLLLPSGRYQLLVQKLGFERLRTSEFELINPAFVNFDLPLTPRKGLRGAIEDLLERFGL